MIRQYLSNNEKSYSAVLQKKKIASKHSLSVPHLQSECPSPADTESNTRWTVPGVVTTSRWWHFLKVHQQIWPLLNFTSNNQIEIPVYREGK
jgi:hypothetical protein